MPDTVYNESEIAQRLAELPGWRFEGGVISREYKTDGWATTLMLVNAIGFFAEAADHHPDLAVSWARVKVSLSTHSAGGVTDKDLALARQIEQTALWRVPRGGPLRGITREWIRGSDAEPA
ncbi:MAG: 4a-hydroxytetrahydrobiopterin dehydratase [Gemmatimonadaceae bacterium]